eukprot:g25808.t1
MFGEAETKPTERLHGISETLEQGDLVLLDRGLQPSRFASCPAVVKGLNSSGCSVAVLDESRSIFIGELHVALSDVVLVHSDWRLGTRVVLGGLQSSHMVHLNGLSAVICPHKRHGHPCFVHKPSSPNTGEWLTLCIRFDEPKKSSMHAVLLEPRFLVADGRARPQAHPGTPRLEGCTPSSGSIPRSSSLTDQLHSVPKQPSGCRRPWMRANSYQGPTRELLLSPRYLVVAAQPEVARSSDWRELIPVGACVPPACKSAKYHPSPGPCAGAFDVDDASCACVTAVHVWRVLCDARFFDELFGAQVRSLPKDSLGESSEFAEHQKAALGHYSTCKEGGGSYVGVYFNAVGEEDPAGAGYALGMCIPSLHTTYSSAVSTIVAWRLGLRMATAYPGVAIDADSVRSAELMHRNELEIEDHFREGSFDYLFRRSHLEHLIRRDELPSAARAGSAGPVRGRRTPLVGIKEPNLLRSSRGRQIMAEMKRTKVLIIFKNWVDWLKSAALFIRPTPCFPRNLARIGEEGNDCSFAFDEAHLFEKVRDLEQKGQEPRKSADPGVARERIKVVHLDTLRAEGPAALRRLGAFLGAGNRSTGSSGSSAGAMPQEGEVAEDEVEFWEEWKVGRNGVYNDLQWNSAEGGWRWKLLLALEVGKAT